MTAANYECPHCGWGHNGSCPRVRAIEYHPNGTIKRVEYYPLAAVQYAASSPLPKLVNPQGKEQTK